MQNESHAVLSTLLENDVLSEKNLNVTSNIEQHETSLAFQDIGSEISSSQTLTPHLESLSLSSDRLSMIAIPLELYLRMRRGESILI